MLDPEQVAMDERSREGLTVNAALAGHFWECLKAAGVPDAVAEQMVIDWHNACITDGVAWADDSE